VERLESRRLYAVWTDTGPVGLDIAANVLPSAGAASGGTTPTATAEGSSAATAPGDVLSVVQTTPAPGAVLALSQSPTSLTIRFNRPFAPISVEQDIGLETVADDGTVSSVDASELTEPTNLTAPTDTLVVSLNATLPAGHYRIVLLGGATLTGADGAPLDNGKADETLGDFTIKADGASLGDATNLGTIGPSPTVASGTLDFQDNPLAVQLYRFTLSPGQHWLFGAEVSAARDGGTLASELALFDAQGKLLATADIGRPDDPTDPFLFAGLAPGTYYIGVSAANNTPGQTGGYDPSSGDPGSSIPTQAGGPFRIHLAATPADAPTQLQSFNLDWADANDSSPTGMTLTFSGPLSLDTLLGKAEGQGSPEAQYAVDQFTALQVVDQTGKAWPVTVSGYREGDNQITLLFDEKLPAGQYTLRVPAQGGITDLAGWTPVAPGEPAGVLATWTVQPEGTETDPHDLGALYRNVHDGIPGWDSLAPGGSTTYRFVATMGGMYSLQTQSQGGPLAIQLIGPNGLQTIDGGASGQLNQISMNLTPGVYELQLIATGSQQVDVDWVLSMKNTPWDSVLDTGLSQGPALNLILFNPGASGTTGAPGSAPSTTPVTATSTTPAPGPQPVLSATSSTAPATPSSPSGASGAAATAGAPAGTAGLVLTLAGLPVGAPLAQPGHLAVVGPATTMSGGPALAMNSPGLLQGIDYGRGAYGQGAYGQGAPIGEPGAAIVDVAPPAPDGARAEPTDGAMVLEGKPVAGSLDEQSLAATDRFGRIAARLLDWFAPAAPHADPALVASAKAEDVAMMTDELATTEPEQIEEAHIAGPLGFAAASILAMRFRRPLRRWLDRRKKAPDGARAASHPPLGRPHHRKSRRTARRMARP
jgi:hypothetical protein